MKSMVTKFDLNTAFKALSEVEYPEVGGVKPNRATLKENFSRKSKTDLLIEDYYSLSNPSELQEVQVEREEEIAQAKLARIEKIVDLDATSAEELLPSYAGKVIIQCPQCMTLFYKNPDDLEYSEEEEGIVNVEEICQHCGNSSGYNVVGKVEAPDATPAEEESASAENEQAEVSDSEEDLNLDLPELNTEDAEVDTMEKSDSATEAEQDQEESAEDEVDEPEDAEKEDKKKEESLQQPLMEEKQEIKEEAIAATVGLGVLSGLLANKIQAWLDRKKNKNVTLGEISPELKADLTKIVKDSVAEAEDKEEEISEVNAEQTTEPLKEGFDFTKLATLAKNVGIETLDDLDAFIKDNNINSEDIIKVLEDEAAAAEELENISLTEDVNTADFNQILDSKEMNTPISETEVKEILNDSFSNVDLATELNNVDNIDEACLEKCITESLCKVYENVNSFKLTECLLKENNFVLSGTIKFNSGAQKTTKYSFTEALKSTKGTLKLTGINEGLSSNGQFILNCNLSNSALLTESFAYKYKINESLVEGLIEA